MHSKVAPYFEKLTLPAEAAAAALCKMRLGINLAVSARSCQELPFFNSVVLSTCSILHDLKLLAAISDDLSGINS